VSRCDDQAAPLEADCFLNNEAATIAYAQEQV
jgi:hypothetical protein